MAGTSAPALSDRPELQPERAPAVLQTQDLDQLRRDVALSEVQDQQKEHLGIVLQKLEQAPQRLSPDERATIRGLITLQLSQLPAQEGESFADWSARCQHNPGVDAELKQVMEAATKGNIKLDQISGLQWQESSSLGDQISQVSGSIVQSARGIGGALLETGEDVLEGFNEWSQKHPGLAIGMTLGGAFLASRAIGKMFGDGWMKKGLHFAGGAFVAGRILGLDTVKDFIDDKIGIKVDDWRVLRALQEYGNFGFRTALFTLAGGDPNETTVGQLERVEQNLEQMLFERGGFADIIFGRENVNWGMEHMALPALQAMRPPRIEPGKAYADLTPQEKALLLNYVLHHTGMIPEREGNRGGMKFEEVEKKEKVEKMDLIFSELARARKSIEDKDNEEILEMVTSTLGNELNGMTNFAIFLNQIDDETRAQVAQQMKLQILSTYDGFAELSQMMDGWKRGEPELLPRGAAIQLVKLEQLFSQYVGNVSETMQSEKVERVVKMSLAATFAIGVGLVPTGIMLMKMVGGGVRILMGAARWGKMAARGGPILLTVAIIVAAGAYVYLEGSKIREQRTSRNPAGWLEYARSQVRNPDEADEKLYELLFLHNEDQAWTGNAEMREFFGVDPEGTEVLELRECREYILKAAILAELQETPFPEGFSAMKLNLYRDRAFQYLDANYRAQHFVPERKEEASRWVLEALRFATLLDTDGMTSERATQMVKENILTGQERALQAQRLRTSIENPTHEVEKPLQMLTAIDRRASLSFTADLYYLMQIRNDSKLSQKIPGYDSSKANEYEEAYRVAVDHLELRGGEGEMLTRMTQGAYNQFQAMIEHVGLPENEEDRWANLPNAEAARLGVFLKLYGEYPEQREVLGMASHATQQLKKMYFENVSDDVAKNPFGRYVMSPVDSARLHDRMGEFLEAEKTIWTILPDFMERIKDKDKKEQMGLAYQFVQRLIALQVGPNTNHSMEKARELMESVLSDGHELPFVSGIQRPFTAEEVQQLASTAKRHLQDLEGDDYESSERDLEVSLDGGTIKVQSSGSTQNISFDENQQEYRLRDLHFEYSAHGLVQAIMAAEKINHLLKKYRDTDFEDEAKSSGEFFYMNDQDWTGISIAESETFGTDDLVLEQQQLYFMALEKDDFVASLNQAMGEVVSSGSSVNARGVHALGTELGIQAGFSALDNLAPDFMKVDPEGTVGRTVLTVRGKIASTAGDVVGFFLDD